MLCLTSCQCPQLIYCVSELPGLAGGPSGGHHVHCSIQLRKKKVSFILCVLNTVKSLTYQGFHLKKHTWAIPECKGCNTCTLKKGPEVVIHHVMVAGWTQCMGRQSTSWSPTDPSPPVLLTCQHINLLYGSCSAMMRGTCRLHPAA